MQDFKSRLQSPEFKIQVTQSLETSTLIPHRTQVQNKLRFMASGWLVTVGCLSSTVVSFLARHTHGLGSWRPHLPKLWTYCSLQSALCRCSGPRTLRKTSPCLTAVHLKRPQHSRGSADLDRPTPAEAQFANKFQGGTVEFRSFRGSGSGSFSLQHLRTELSGPTTLKHETPE